jgi:hypothetical protein
MNAEERLAYLLESAWVPTNATITVSEIVGAVGSLDAARLVVGTLQAGASQDPILAASYQALSTVGMSLSGADRQELIDQLAIAGQWPDAVRDAVKALGGTNRPRWQIEGYAAEPTLESVQVELDAENQPADETRHEVLLSCNRGTDGVMRVMARVTPVEYANDVLLRRGESKAIVNDAALVAALVPIIEGLMQ